MVPWKKLDLDIEKKTYFTVRGGYLDQLLGEA